MSLGRKIEEFQANLERLRTDLTLSIGKVSGLSDQLKDYAETQLREVALSDNAGRLLSKSYTDELYASSSSQLKDRVDGILQSINNQPFFNLIQQTNDLTSELADEETLSQAAKIDALR